VLRCVRGVSDLVPQYLIDAMTIYASNVESSNANLMAASTAIAAEFRERNCEVMFAKGTVFNVLIHGGDQRRLSKDVDVYVRRGDVHAAYDILRGIGYTGEIYSLEESLGNLQHHSMYSPEREVMVELHWTIAPVWNNIRVDVDALLSAAVTIEIDGAALRVPRVEDRLLFLCLELEKEAWSSLKRLVDFSTLVSTCSGRDLDRATAAVRQSGKLRLLSVSLDVASDLGLLSLPDELAPLARSDAIARRIAELTVERIRRGPLPLWKRMYKEVLLAQKHDRFSAQVLHLWRVSVLWRLSKAVRVVSRRAQRSQSGPNPPRGT
jgi:hypothetical protein